MSKAQVPGVGLGQLLISPLLSAFPPILQIPIAPETPLRKRFSIWHLQWKPSGRFIELSEDWYWSIGKVLKLPSEKLCKRTSGWRGLIFWCAMMAQMWHLHALS